jgi:plastocyanin
VWRARSRCGSGGRDADSLGLGAAWVNKDLFPHTVTSDKVFDSGSIAVDASWGYVANTTGVYAYSCTFHPTMKGSITVQ